MTFSQGLEFIETIEPTFENAIAVQVLTLQDIKHGGFQKPLELADPSNSDMVATQQQKLHDHPERYSGYTRDGQLVAYIKQNDWFAGDELPFATGARAVELKASRALHLDPSTGQWGVFGLVASDNLDKDDRESVLLDLLQRSFADPRSGESRTVNIVIHEHDPLLEIAVHYGFVPVGKLGEAAGAPGLMQQRYQRPSCS
jgi:hypothetical protein